MVDHFNDLSVLKPDCVRYRSELTADTPSGHFLVKTLPREDADTPIRRHVSLPGLSDLFDDIVMDGVYCRQGDTCYLRIWHSDPKGLFHADDQLERVNGIQAKAVRTEER